MHVIYRQHQAWFACHVSLSSNAIQSKLPGVACDTLGLLAKLCRIPAALQAMPRYIITFRHSFRDDRRAQRELQMAKRVKCPPGAGPGSPVTYRLPNGGTLQLVVPAGIRPGMIFTVGAAVAAAQAAPHSLQSLVPAAAQRPIARGAGAASITHRGAGAGAGAVA